MREILSEELSLLYDRLRKEIGVDKSGTTIIFVKDENGAAQYCQELFSRLQEEQGGLSIHNIDVNEIGNGEQPESRPEQMTPIHMLEQVNWKEPVYILFLLDFQNAIYEKENIRNSTLALLSTVLAGLRHNIGSKLILSYQLPKQCVWSGPVTHVAEMELTQIFLDCKEDSLGHYIYQLEQRIADADIAGKCFCLRMGHIFGPGIDNNDRLELSNYTGLLEGQVSEICAEDKGENFSCVYIRDALNFIFSCVSNKYRGDTYNVAAYSINRSKICLSLYEIVKNKGVSLNIRCAGKQTTHQELETLKARSMGWRPIDWEEALYRTLCDRFGAAYSNARIVRKFHGRLEQLHRLEIEILQQIDSICKAHDIRYFLVGGSLLGAVRHHGFIPWDDDLDIGMLREDYEKFRKICPKELPKKYWYQSYRTERDDHYIFDKIRLRDTVFATQFSKRFDIENGVFVDILVYDKTSSNALIQRMHIHAISVLKRMINIRWVNRPRKGIHYIASVIFLPVMRLIPFKVYHGLYELLIRLFNRSDSDMYIDSVGMNLHRGAFPGQCICGETICVPFEDIQVPIPSGWHEYLVHWYGQNYMELPPVAQRMNSHSIANMDLGKYRTET